MVRRCFLATLAMGALAPSTGTSAEERLRRVGWLDLGTAANTRPREVLFSRSRELGWLEGKNIAFDWLYADAKVERLAPLMAELIRRKVDVIVTTGTTAIRAAMDATTTVPIVMAGGGDPVGAGLIGSLARPGGNVTGVSLLGRELMEKHPELLKQPRDPRRPWPRRSRGRVWPHYRRCPFMLLDPMFFANRRRIAELAIRRRLRLMTAERTFAEAGFLVTYGAGFAEVFRLTAAFVDKILRGAKPADLPVEQPTKFELIINLKTAKALGLTIPPSLLARADQVIE